MLFLQHRQNTQSGAVGKKLARRLSSCFSSLSYETRNHDVSHVILAFGTLGVCFQTTTAAGAAAADDDDDDDNAANHKRQ